MRVKKINPKLRSRIILISIFLFSFFNVSYGEKIADLPMVMNPFFITIGHGRIYITEKNSSIHIFKLDNGNVVFEKTFGEKGEGPGEFKFIHRLSVKDDYLEIPSFGKYARFTFEGKFIDEKKLPFRVFKNNIYKIGDNYLTRDYIFSPEKSETVIKLWDKNFNLIKKLGNMRGESTFTRINPVPGYYLCLVANNSIYIVDSAMTTRIKIFDRDGKYRSELKLPVSGIKLNSKLKEKIIGELIQMINKEIWKSIKKRMFYPGFVPGLNWFGIDDETMIARTYRFNDDKVEFVFFNTDGKVIKEMFMYDTGRISNGMTFCFSDGKYYYLKENFDEERWELFAEKIF